ncbi:MAG: acetyl-CoA carboxylase carboxyltransferase subunit alpha [Thermoanaerobaculia bacterium]|nr:acetyl-CoA carboxylase carboxyltransferase subunit alpha [Thermoanaerobaculia bacterium]
MSTDLASIEEPLLQLRRQIQELAEAGEDTAPLEGELGRLTRDAYAKLSPWQTTLVARHGLRPYTLDFIAMLFEDFVELHGDRKFADDSSIVGGFGLFNGVSCAVIGHQKGRDTKEKIARNFGMSRPEGYRKALRLMKTAERFGRPIFTFIDTPGAYPGVGAEERGQAEAIAVNLREMAGLKVPIIVTVTGEGGSGGALALGVGDRVFMLEHSVYSVISPEGCAAILWKDPTAASRAAEVMRITAKDLKRLGVIDEIIPEPEGGAHTNHVHAAALLRPYLESALSELMAMAPDRLPDHRYDKFRKMGVFEV